MDDQGIYRINAMSMQADPHYFASIEQVQHLFAGQDYLCDRMLATSIFLATRIGKPLMLEGEPGVGKTEVAKVLAAVLETDLIRLQCYEGLDTSTALYEWNYPRQMLELRLQEARGTEKSEIGINIFSEDFLLSRPLLEAIKPRDSAPPVLLIDEIDRSDAEFEAFLLEILSDFQITIPELGAIKATEAPIVVLTSNCTRQLHDALKRRCLFHWIDYPGFDRELRIIKARVPGIQEHLAGQVCALMQWLRQADLFKRPGTAESIDWARALLALCVDELDPELLKSTIGCVVKNQRDLRYLQQMDTSAIIEQSRHDLPG